MSNVVHTARDMSMHNIRTKLFNILANQYAPSHQNRRSKCVVLHVRAFVINHLALAFAIIHTISCHLIHTAIRPVAPSMILVYSHSNLNLQSLIITMTIMMMMSIDRFNLSIFCSSLLLPGRLYQSVTARSPAAFTSSLSSRSFCLDRERIRLC